MRPLHGLFEVSPLLRRQIGGRWGGFRHLGRGGLLPAPDEEDEEHEQGGHQNSFIQSRSFQGLVIAVGTYRRTLNRCASSRWLEVAGSGRPVVKATTESRKVNLIRCPCHPAFVDAAGIGIATGSDIRIVVVAEPVGAGVSGET